MPESPGLYQRLSVTENMEYFARLYGLPPRRARIAEAVGLADRVPVPLQNPVHGL